ncbi:hypothetical protein BGX20_002474, partial [Mortierella sp. AD010]
MDNLTIGPVNNLRSRNNDTNPSELVNGRSTSPHLAIDMEGTHDLVPYPTASTQDTIVPTQDTTSLLGVPSEVWYFDEGTHNLCRESKLPLEITIVERMTPREWRTEDCQLEPGLYNLVFGISTQFFDASLVDSIVFYIDINGNYQSQVVEVISGKYLREFLEQSNAAGQAGQICELKLHQQIGVDDQQIDDNDQQTEVDDQHRDGFKLNVKMEIHLRHDISPETTQRVLSMHYFELYKCSETKAQGTFTAIHYGNQELISNMKLISTCVIGSPMHVHKTYAHKPYVWSIDVRHRENPNDPVRSLKINRYSISGDGKRVATLSETNDSLFLDLWDISGPEGSAPHSPEKLAKIRLKRPDGRTHTDPHASIAVSWNASYITLFPTTEESWVEQLAFYDGERSDKLDKLTPIFDSHSGKELPKFKGEAKFHITNTNNPEPSNELFITCNGYSVDIYKVYGQWSHIFRIQVQPPESIYLERLTIKKLRELTENFARKLIGSLQGKFFLSFSVIGSDLRPLIWDIKKHSLVVAMTGSERSSKYPMFATFSNDQSILAILQDGSIRTYWTGSKAAIGEWAVPPYLHISRLMFVRNDTQLLVECTDSTKQERVGYILDPMTTRMTLRDKNLIGKVLGPGEYMPEVYQRYGDCYQENNIRPQRIYSCRNSKLDFIQLDNITYDPDSLNTRECGQQMCNGTSLIPITSEAFKSESGLEFKYEFNASENSQEFKISMDTDTYCSASDDNRMFYKLPTFLLKISDGLHHKSFRIPTVTPSAASKGPTVFFLSQKMLLILCSNVMITVWKLPVKYNDECTLLTARWIEDKRISSNTTTTSVDIKQCEYHQHLFIRDSEDVEYTSR